MCSDAQAKGATCVISSLTPKNEWRRGTSNTFVSMYPSLAKQAAAAAGATYLPHEEAAISILNTLGQSLSGQTFLSGNSQQTNVGGADLMAASFVGECESTLGIPRAPFKACSSLPKSKPPHRCSSVSCSCCILRRGREPLVAVHCAGAGPYVLVLLAS